MKNLFSFMVPTLYFFLLCKKNFKEGRENIYDQESSPRARQCTTYTIRLNSKLLQNFYWKIFSHLPSSPVRPPQISIFSYVFNIFLVFKDSTIKGNFKIALNFIRYNSKVRAVVLKKPITLPKIHR